ncbi:MAG: type II toxin-antitoxin system death-on-curing family toxin [Actinobacteria bacterium]|nr:type II toxin-antitoxin system death-on-curing family toxin [Actinomycetota bacterium]
MTSQSDDFRGDVVLYQAPNGTVELDVRLERETLWLSLDQMASLFDRDKSVISRHLRNVFREGELEREAVVAKNATTAADGKTYRVEFFNLDAIISVGYRVNSRRGTQFRIWATNVLKDHILKGYSVNQNRLRDLNQAVRLIADTVNRRDLSGDEAKALLRVVGEYSHALDLLDDYDHQRVDAPAATGKVVHMMSYEEALRIVAQLRGRFGESAVFGVEKDKGLASALGAVMQTGGGADVYPSLEQKAAHLLYFLVKNHAFVDGNKRIAAALFLWFLERNGVLTTPAGEHLISDAALVSTTLMIAESRPEEKDVLVRIVTHFLCEPSRA